MNAVTYCEACDRPAAGAFAYVSETAYYCEEHLAQAHAIEAARLTHRVVVGSTEAEVLVFAEDEEGGE